MGADRPSTPARRAWLSPRSSMSLRKSAPNGSPYQFRCSSRALAVASCCAASICVSPSLPQIPRFAVANHVEHLTESGRPRGPPIFLRDLGGDPVLWSPAPVERGTFGRTLLFRGLSSVGRALSLHGRCQGFDSPRLHIRKSPPTCGNAGRRGFCMARRSVGERAGGGGPGALVSLPADDHAPFVTHRITPSRRDGATARRRDRRTARPPDARGLTPLPARRFHVKHRRPHVKPDPVPRETSLWGRRPQVSCPTVMLRSESEPRTEGQWRSSRSAASSSASLAWTSGSRSDWPLPSTDVR